MLRLGLIRKEERAASTSQTPKSLTQVGCGVGKTGMSTWAAMSTKKVGNIPGVFKGELYGTAPILGFIAMFGEGDGSANERGRKRIDQIRFSGTLI